MVIFDICILWEIMTTIRSSNHLSPHKINTILLIYTPYSILYTIMAYLFYIWEFVLLDPLHPFHFFPTSLHSGNHQFIPLYMSVFQGLVGLFCFFRFHICQAAFFLSLPDLFPLDNTHNFE